MAPVFVDRAGERQQLTGWLASAADEKPVTVMIEGNAGVGKSRLIGWFADEMKRRALVLSGACIELNGGTSIPYGALVEAMRLFVRQAGPSRAQRLVGGRSWPALSGLISEFTGPSPAMTSPDPQPRIFGAVLGFADHIGQREPLVLVFEDVHWADASTLDLIRYLTKAKTNERLMLVCTFRPVIGAARHPLHALLGDPDFNRRAQRLTLSAFGRQELDEFVATLTSQPVSDQRLRRYFELSEGNAYYAEQLVTADDASSSDVQVPQSLRALMVARLHQLGDDAAEVVRIAAVAGRRVGDDLLLAASGLDEPALDLAVRECVRQRILTHDGVEETYAFEHALLRDTAYRELSPRVRKRLHARVAEALVGLPDDKARLMPDVADHWFAAGRLPEAFAAAIRAAEPALRMRAFAEAEELYARALRLWPDIGDAAALAGGPREQILGRAADAARWAGHVTQALDWVREAIAEVRAGSASGGAGSAAGGAGSAPGGAGSAPGGAGSAPGRAGELVERLGSYLWEAGQHEESAAAYAEAERLLEGLLPSAVASRVQAAMATAAIRAGNYQVGLDRAHRAAELARAVGAKAEEGRALNSVGLALGLLGRADEGEKALRAALVIADDVDNLEDLFRGYGNLGVCLEQAGRLGDAVAAMLEGLHRVKECGLLGSRNSGLLANNAAVALLSLGRYPEAAALLDSILLVRPVAESRYARLTKAEMFVIQGDFSAAERLLEESRTLPNTDPRFVGPLYGCMAESLLWQGRPAEARSIVDRGMAAIRDAGSVRAVVQLCAVGLRAAADSQRQADRFAGRTEPVEAGLAGWADALAAAVRAAAKPPSVGMRAEWDEGGVLVRQCYAEQARVRREDTPEMWADIVDGWATIERPLQQAYALYRQADACARTRNQSSAAAAARQAYAIAGEIGAEPLRRQVAELAGELRPRVRLDRHRPYDLTPTELRVLRELTIGRTYQEIGKVLFISPKTVGVHASAIFRKLGVRNRAEAAEMARREGLTDGSDAPSAR